MTKQSATTDEVDTSTEDNELEAYFDDENSDVEADSSVDIDDSELEEDEGEDESDEESAATDDDADDDQSEEDETAETDESSENGSEETQAEEEDTTSDEQEESTSDKSKEELAQEAFKRREAERKLREAHQQREVETLQNYLKEAGDDEAELLRRQAEVQNYVLTKQRSEVFEKSLDVDMRRAVADLGLKDMDEPTRNYVMRRLDEFEATRVLRDQQGNVVDVRGDVYQYLTDELGSIAQFKSTGAREQTKKKTVERARTVTKPTRAPKEKPVDDDLAAFDEEADKW